MIRREDVITVAQMRAEGAEEVIYGGPVSAYVEWAWERCWGKFESEGRAWQDDAVPYPGKN